MMRLLRLPGVFRPHSDSWMLVEQLKREVPAPGTRVLDICTGSGLIAVAAARLGASPVVAVDVSRRAVLTARLNARLNGVSLRAVRGDLFEPVKGEHFDVITSNPPYVPGPDLTLPARGPARAWEGGPDGRSFIDRICSGARAQLRPGGILLLVQSSFCGERETVASLLAQGFETAIVRRRRGRLGPRMRSRVNWLRQRSLLGEDETEELLVVRAQRGA